MRPVTNHLKHGIAYIQDILHNLVLPTFWWGGSVNLLPDHPYPTTQNIIPFICSIFPLYIWETLLADLSILPKFHKLHNHVGPYCTHLHPTNLTPLHKKWVLILTPHHTLLWLMQTFSPSKLILFNTNKLSSSQKLQQSQSTIPISIHPNIKLQTNQLRSFHITIWISN